MIQFEVKRPQEPKGKFQLTTLVNREQERFSVNFPDCFSSEFKSCLSTEPGPGQAGNGD